MCGWRMQSCSERGGGEEITFCKEVRAIEKKDVRQMTRNTHSNSTLTIYYISIQIMEGGCTQHRGGGFLSFSISSLLALSLYKT